MNVLTELINVTLRESVQILQVYMIVHAPKVSLEMGSLVVMVMNAHPLVKTIVTKMPSAQM